MNPSALFPPAEYTNIVRFKYPHTSTLIKSLQYDHQVHIKLFCGTIYPETLWHHFACWMFSLQIFPFYTVGTVYDPYDL